MKTKLFNNLLLKILSVVAAVLLWLVVVNIDDAVGSKVFRNIKVNIQGADVLTTQGQMYLIQSGTDTVDLTVYARRSVLNELVASDFVVTANIKKDLLYGNMVKIEVEYTGSFSVERIEQSRANVLVSIEEMVTEQFKVSVKTNGNPSDNLAKGSAIPAQTLIEITGPKSIVEQIRRVELEVSITGITGTVVRTSPVNLYDNDNRLIDGTYLEYIGKEKGLDVTVTTLEKKLVGINFDVSGAAPAGYGLEAISYVPETVTIAGLKSQISPIYNLNIPPQALNPEGRTGRIEQTVDISQYLADGVIIPDEDDREIVVTMDIVPYESVVHIVPGSQIQFENIQEGLTLDASKIGVLEVVVSGLAADLPGVTIDRMSVRVDLGGFQRPGTYQAPVTVTAPGNCHVPDNLEMTVTLKRAGAE